MSAGSSSFSWVAVDAAVVRGDANGAAAAVLDGLRAVDFDQRKAFFSQLSSVLLRQSRATETANCAAEAGKILWGMPEVRHTQSFASDVTGEALLLAAAVGAAYAAAGNLDQAVTYDAEVLRSSVFFTYDGFSPLDRLACVARVLEASRVSGNARLADVAMQRGMSDYHSLAHLSRHNNSGDEEAQRHRDAVVHSYLLERGLYRQDRQDYLLAVQSFLALYDSSGDVAALHRAALCALCTRAGEAERLALLRAVLQRYATATAALPLPLHHHILRVCDGHLLTPADMEDLLTAAGAYLPTHVLHNALREHNILLLAHTLECVHWQSLLAHMGEQDMTESELHDLLVSMVQGQRLGVAIHHDTGFIEFACDNSGAAAHAPITDADALNRIAAAAAAISKAHPELLRC
ncbi:cop9 signalosome complex subunit [Novymonas esmeraldas]|uniref:Cop9 signalosome complex subunit n=1 Tax=Novymonas esmeraldas TaxID=1808958 RepID=A0AAW0F8W2_9TRYP